MFKAIGTWLILAAALFAGYNWFLAPNFVQVRDFMAVLSPLSAAGLSGITVFCCVLFGKKL